MSRFHIEKLFPLGVTQVTRQCLGDHRGYFTRIFCAEELSAVGWNKPIAQINHTYTQKSGTVRGMHFQRDPYCEMKLVSCLRGEIFDVAVDLRAGSPTYLQWQAVILSAANHRALLIPEGFAHGFQSLVDDVELLYCHSAPYSKAAEAGLLPTDPSLRISWPKPITEISFRDSSHPLLTESEGPFI